MSFDIRSTQHFYNSNFDQEVARIHQHAFTCNSGQLAKWTQPTIGKNSLHQHSFAKIPAISKKTRPSSHISLINRKKRYRKPPRAERKGVALCSWLKKHHASTRLRTTLASWEKKAWPSLSHSSLINRKERYPKPPRAERKGIIPWLCLQKKHYQHAFARNAGKKNIAIPLTPLTQIWSTAESCFRSLQERSEKNELHYGHPAVPLFVLYPLIFLGLLFLFFEFHLFSEYPSKFSFHCVKKWKAKSFCIVHLFLKSWKSGLKNEFSTYLSKIIYFWVTMLPNIAAYSWLRTSDLCFNARSLPPGASL